MVQQILVLVVRQRRRVIEEIDQKDADGDDDAEDNPQLRGVPSKEAISKFKDYGGSVASFGEWNELKLVSAIPYISDEHADAATKNAKLKLVFRLLEFTIQDEGVLFLRCIQTRS